MKGLKFMSSESQKERRKSVVQEKIFEESYQRVSQCGKRHKLTDSRNSVNPQKINSKNYSSDTS